MRLIEIFLETLQQEERMELAPKWLVDDARHVLTRAWSMYAVYFWIVIGSGIAVASLTSDWLQGIIGPGIFGITLFVASVSFGIARVKKQPGTDE